jgi:predicted component of type VI protein secretion system
MDTEMNQTLLTCPMCKRVNEVGTRFCRGCGRLLVEPNLELAESEHAPFYESQDSLPVVSVMPPTEPAQPTTPINAAYARLIIRLLPPETPDAAAGGASDQGAPEPRVSEYALDGQNITIGRTQGCDIIFDGDTLTSRRHAILRFDANHYILADLGSSNGTFVNDIEITTPTTLKHGDRILIGEHELLFLLDQARPIVPAAQSDAPAQAPVYVPTTGVLTNATLEEPAEASGADVVSEDASAKPDAGEPGFGEPARATAGPAPDRATAKYASVSRLSSELAASASRMVAPQPDDADMAAVRTRLLEASEALARQATQQTALAERRRAVLVETREHVADLLADLRGDDTVANSPVQHHQQIGLIELVDAVAANPNDRERMYTLAQRADELAHALRAVAPSEGRWSYERAHTVRNLEDILYHLRNLP